MLPDSLPDLLLLIGKEPDDIRRTLHLMPIPVGSNERIKLFDAEILLDLLSINNIVATIDLPHTMIKTDAVDAAIA